MQDVNRSLRRSSASSSHQTFLNLEYREKTELKRVIDFLQEQYEGLASELASKELELKVAKSRRMPSESFELRNQEYETKSEINQLKFKHMTELQETMAQHQLEIDIIKNEFQEKLERQYENFKREFSRNKKESSSKMEEDMMDLSQKNIELTRVVSQLEVKLKEHERRTASPESEQEIRLLKKSLVEKDMEIQRLERHLAESEQYNQEMKLKLSQKNKEIDYFVSEMNREKSHSRSTMFDKPSPLSARIQKPQKPRTGDVSDLSDQLIFIKEENDRLRKLNDKYKGLVTDKQTHIEELNGQIASLDKQIDSQSFRIDSLTQQIKEYHTGKKIFESEMSRLNDNIQKGLGDVNSKQGEIKDLLATIQRLKGEGHILNARIADQDSEKKRLEEIISRQNDRLGLLEEEIRSFNIRTQKKDSQTIQLNGLIEYNKSQYKGLQIAFQTKQSQYQILCNQNRDYLLNNQSLKNELNDSKRQVDELRHKLHKTEEDNGDLLQSLKELKVQYQNVRIENSTLKEFEDACSHLRSEIVQLEHQLKLVKEDNRREIEETYRYKLEYESALVELQEAELRLKEVDAERMDFADKAELLEQLRKYTEVVETTSKLNSQLSNEMRSLKEGNSRLAEEKLGLERKLERVEEKSLKSRVVDNSKVSSLGQLQSEVTRLQLLATNLENQKRFFETKAEDATREKQKLMGTLQRQLADMNSTSREKEDQSKHELETLYKTVSDAKQEIHHLKQELNSLSADNTKMRSSFKGEHELQVMEIEGLREQLRRKSHENQTLNKRWNTLKEEQMQRLSSDKHLNTMLESELSATKTKLDLTQVNLKDRQSDVERLNNKYQKLGSEKQAMEIQLDKLKIEQWKYRTGTENLEREKQSLTKQLKSKELLFQQELNTLKADNQELAASNQELTEYVKDLEKERNRLEVDNQMMEQGLESVTKERNESKEELARVELDLASTRVENESLKRKKPEILSPKTSFTEVGKLKEELEKEKKLRKSLEEDMEGLRKKGNVPEPKSKEHKRRDTDTHSVQPKNTDLEMEIRRLNQQLRVNGIEFSELLKYRSDLEMKLIQTGDQLRKLRQQLSNKQGNQSQPVSPHHFNSDHQKMTEYIRELETRCKMVEDINNQLRKKQYQQQEKVTRILADNKAELTHYKLENNRLEKDKTELEMRVKQVHLHLSEVQNQRSAKVRSTNEDTNQLRQELRNVYGQIHSLNSLLIQKQSQISNLIKSREPTVFGSLQHISSPKQKQKKTLKNTEDCWRDMQDRIKAGQKEFNKARMYN